MKSKTILQYIILLITLYSCNNQNGELKILIAGDVILDRGVNDQLKLHGDSLLLSSLKEFNEKDFFIINYEGTLTNSDKNQDDKYNFKANKNRASILRDGGITHASIANNHSFDFGEQGYFNTLEALVQNNITPLGKSCNPQLITKGKSQCALLSVSLTTHNEAFCIYTIEELKKSVKIFSNENPQIPLVLYIHWGLELQKHPENWQKDLAKSLIDLGVDAIIGHHPHVVQSVEFIEGVPVFYSIGNFVADAYLPLTDKSIVVNLSISDQIDKVEIIPIELDRYFPKKIVKKEYLRFIREVFSYSPGIALIQKDSVLQVKALEEVNFTEKTNQWIFPAKDYFVTVKSLTSGSHLLVVINDDEILNPVCLHGELSELEIGDIDNDGHEDILVGISKKVKFDQQIKKRINIFSVKNGNVQALWLGTKFIYDVESFKISQSEDVNYLSTIECDSLGHKYKAIYNWDDFGFALNNIKPIK